VVRELGLPFRVGIRLSSRAEETAGTDSERRKTPRWICSQDFFPTCVALTPGRYNDYMYFQIRDISPEGMRLVCSLRNKFLLQGMKLKLMVSFPMVGEANIGVEIVRVGITSEGGRDFLIVGVRYSRLERSAKNIVAQYLVQFSDVDDIDSLREQGLIPSSVSRGVDFYFLKSEPDYREVLSLRLQAHLADGNIQEESVSAEDLADMRDATGRILVGKHNGRIVATGRIHFGEADVPLEQEDYVEWPNDLPRRERIVELGRVCTDPAFRKGDLFARIIQQVITTCIRVDRPHVLIVSLPHLLSLYKKLGCQETGLVHEQSFWRGEQHLLMINVFDVCLGKGVSPLVWYALYREPSEFLVENGMLECVGMDRIRVRILGLIGRVFSGLVNLSKIFRK